MKPSTVKSIPKEINKLILDSAWNGDNATLEHLIGTGINLEISNEHQQTPLYLAVKNNKFETVKLLVKNNANINSKECDDWTPLHRAAANNNIVILKFLLANGANYKVRNKEGLKAFDIGNFEVKQTISDFVIEKTDKLEKRVKTLEQQILDIFTQLQELKSQTVTNSNAATTQNFPKPFFPKP